LGGDLGRREVALEKKGKRRKTKGFASGGECKVKKRGS